MKEYKCKHCDNYYKSEKSLKYHIRKYHNNMISGVTCKICNNNYYDNSGLFYHIKFTHKISKKKYYDLYYKKDGDSVCIICSGSTNFYHDEFRYFDYCSSKCVNNDPNIRDKIDNTKMKKYGYKNNTQSEYYKKLNSNIWKNKNDIEILEIVEKRKQTCLKKYGADNPMKIEETKEKIKETNRIVYGTDYGLQNFDVINKRKQTCLEKYGVENIFQNEKIKQKIKQKMIDNGFHVCEENYTEFKNYYKKCVSLTLRNIKQYKFKENWNGLDYYDNEYIKENYDKYVPSDENYPNIDHKISIGYGFNNDIDIETISSIDNLCITKRSHNMRKMSRTEEQYWELLNFKCHK